MDMIDGTNRFDEEEIKIPPKLTNEERLIDCQKENAALRDAISDAWQTHNRCQDALTEAQKKIAELLVEALYCESIRKADADQHSSGT